MSKWMKVDPATLKVGDEVRMVDAFSMFQISGKTSPSKIGICVGRIDFTEAPGYRTWFVRKPKKAKPEPDLVEGHDATHWHRRFLKQLNHNEQIERSATARNQKLQRLEKEVNDARKDAQYWQDKYAVLAASINEVPDEPSPPTRPDEPPVGSFFRVDRTGREFYRYPQVSLTHYFHLACDAGDRPWVAWADVTEPGDTWTLLELREVGK